MQFRSSVILLLSSILIVVSGGDVHQHWEHHHDHGSAVADVVVDDDDDVVGLNEESPEHILAHLRGDVDVGGVAKAAGSVVSWQLPVFIVGVLLKMTLLLPALLSLPVRRVTWRPPDWRLRSYLIPPSQAPPIPA